ncbi:hypothetical protein MRX96_042009 [Rhipicephalus microplus]
MEMVSGKADGNGRRPSPACTFTVVEVDADDSTVRRKQAREYPRGRERMVTFEADPCVTPMRLRNHSLCTILAIVRASDGVAPHCRRWTGRFDNETEGFMVRSGAARRGALTLARESHLHVHCRPEGLFLPPNSLKP